MAKIQKNFIAGKMNKSVDERLVPQGQYIDALNVRLGSTEGTEIGAVENSKGNELLVELKFLNQPLSASARCIGAYEDGANETIYWFVNDENNSLSATGKVDLIVSFNTRKNILFYHVISTSVLNFDKEYLINGIDLIGELLFFTDNLNAPRKININRNYLEPNVPSTTDRITEQDIGVIVAPPLNAPEIESYQIGGGEDYMNELFLSFAYRWQYEDGEYSVLSPFSRVAFTPGPFDLNYQTYDNDGMSNIFNTTDITFDTGSRNVKDIDVIFKFSTSQSVNIIEKFNKENEGWLDNVNQTLTFNNKKIYTTLPEAQLLRLFDNVPRIAQGQTIMGNRLMYGNYVDGYDIKGADGREIYLDYDLSLISEPIQEEEIQSVSSDYTYTLGGVNANVTDAKITIDFGGVDLINGSQIGVVFDYRSTLYTDTSGTYEDGTQPENTFESTFVFNIQQDYSSVYELSISAEFINAVSEFVAIQDSSCFDFCTANCTSGSSQTDVFNCGISTKIGWVHVGFGFTASPQGIIIESAQGSDEISFVLPAIKFEEYDQTQNPPTPTGVFAYEYLSSIDSVGLYAKDESKQSLHSNRDYEVAIVYMDDYGRSSTALVDTSNTVFIPCEKSITKNNIRVQLNSYPPYWATKYKFVIKESKGLYRTIYSNVFFQEEGTGIYYFKLEGDNRDKVEDNSVLHVKKDTSGAVLNCAKTKVLGLGVEVDDFLCQKDVNGEIIEGSEPCGQFAGTYMQLKPNGFVASAPENSFIETEDVCGSGSYCSAYADVSIPNPDYVPTDPPTDPTSESDTPFFPADIPAGSIINIKLRTNRRSNNFTNCPSIYYDYDRRFISSNDYASLYDFVIGDNIDLTSGISSGERENTILFIDDLLEWPNQDIPGGSPDSNPAGGIGRNGTTFIYFQQDSWDNPYIPPSPPPPGPPIATKTGRQFLTIQTGTPKCGGPIGPRYSYGKVIVEIQRAPSLMVFETDPLEANDELYYENEQTFDIENGFHLSGDANADQNQTATLPAIVDLSFFNCYTFGNGVESMAVLDALTSPTLNLGEKVTSVSEEEFKEAHRFSDVTYSGVFNQETNLNKLNQFNLSLTNFKTLEASYGPIRKMHSRQTDILILQEDKISYLQVGKNLLSDAAAGGAITSVPEVLGKQIARIEEYGISNNPESFTAYGYDIFFTDAKRNAVLQIKGGSAQADRLSVISEVGMRSWFRDLFRESFETQKLGGFDPYMNEYVLGSSNITIPQPLDERECGFVLEINELESSYSFMLDLTSIIGDVQFDYNVTGGSLNILVEWNNNAVIADLVTGTGNVSFNKSESFPTQAKVTLFPGAGDKPSFTLNLNCPVGDELTVKEIVINFNGDVSLTTTCRYRWQLSDTLSPYSTNSVVLESDGVSLFTEQTGTSSFGTIPALGSTVIMQNRQNPGQTFEFDANSDKFKYLTTNVDYNEVDLNTLIPLLNTATPITGSFPEYQASFTYSTQATYMYLVWDLRESDLLQFCYDSSTPEEACCECD